jgi:hypothetical protein
MGGAAVAQLIEERADTEHLDSRCESRDSMREQFLSWLSHADYEKPHIGLPDPACHLGGVNPESRESERDIGVRMTCDPFRGACDASLSGSHEPNGAIRSSVRGGEIRNEVRGRAAFPPDTVDHPRADLRTYPVTVDRIALKQRTPRFVMMREQVEGLDMCIGDDAGGAAGAADLSHDVEPCPGLKRHLFQSN